MNAIIILLSVLLGGWVVCAVLSFVIAWLARMRGYGWRLTLVLIPAWTALVAAYLGWPLRPGFPFMGGARLVYDVRPISEEVSGGARTDTFGPDQMDRLIAAISRRLNPRGVLEVSICAAGPRQIDIICPSVHSAEIERFERVLGRNGALEFRILANRRDHEAIIELALDEPSKTQILDSSGNRLAWWVPVKEGEERIFTAYDDIGRRTRKVADREVTEILVVKDMYNVTGEYLTRAEPGTDHQGRPCVNFVFNSTGGQLFGKLTGSHLPDRLTEFTYKLGIILDGELYSAPAIQSTIYDRGEITGSFSQCEVQELVSLLNAGSLPATLNKEPVSRLIIDPPTWPKWLLWLGITGITLVLLQLLLAYAYGLVGLAAAGAWFLNALMVFSAFLFLRWPVTPASIFGLAITLGLATVCNWFVCESIRRSGKCGADQTTAIWKGYRRGLIPIIALQLCAWIGGSYLSYFSYSQIRSVGSILALGSVPGLFTSLFCLYVLLDIVETIGGVSFGVQVRAER